MDPISGAIGVAGALVTLSGLALSIGKTLTNIASIHGGPALLLYSLAGACKAIEIAWNNIQSWLENQRTLESVGESLLDQLMSAIEVGKIVLGALKQDLKPYELTLIDPPRVNGRVLPKFRAMQRLKAVLNEGILKDHCVRLNLQVSSLHLLLATTKLPTARAQSYVCDCLRPVFRKDEDTAWTIVASQNESSRDFSLARPETKPSDKDSYITYRSFAFTNDLLTAPVYRRLALKALCRPPTTRSSYPTATVASHSSVLAGVDDADSQYRAAESISTTTRAQLIVEEPVGCMNNSVEYGQDDPQRHISAIFSKCVHCDVIAFNNGEREDYESKLLPLHSRLRREQKTQDEKVAIDARFINAVKGNDLLRLGEALDLGADINAWDEDREPALFCWMPSESRGSDAVPNFLLSYKDLNVHARSFWGDTALHVSASLRRPNIARSLLRRGIALEDKDSNGETPLHRAALQWGRSDCLVEILNEARARNVSIDSITNTAGMTALHAACLSWRYFLPDDNISLLLNAGCSPAKKASVHGFTSPVSALFLAVAEKSHSIVEMILQTPKHAVDVNIPHGPTPCLLQLAMEKSDECVPHAGAAIVLALLRAGAAYSKIEESIYNWSFGFNTYHGSAIQDFLRLHSSRIFPHITDTYIDV